MKSALIFPPQWFPSQPYLATPTLKGYLEGKGHSVDQFDFNIESYDIFLSAGYLRYCADVIRQRLDAPAYSLEIKEVKKVYRQILGDREYLEAVIASVEDAKEALRDRERFFHFASYKDAVTTLKVALQLVSYAHFPTRIDLEALYMDGAPEDHLDGILQATGDAVANPYLALFRDRILPGVDWRQYGLVGVSIIHVGQVIPALTLARLLRARFPHLHLVIGGSVFNRHANVLDSKQPLFTEFFHSVVLYEGELPLARLIEQVAAGGALHDVPNLLFLDNGRVVRTAAAKALPYEELERPVFDQLPLRKYFMPFPVLPYMASRGCYWGKCTFCTHSFIYDSYYRKDNEERVAADLAHYVERYGARYFTFSDEAVSPNAFQRMSRAFLARSLDVRSLAMIKFESHNVENARLFEEMYRAGFIMLFYGLESANDRILGLIDKGTDQATEEKVLLDSARAGIWNHTYLFFGFPTEERREAEETIRFVMKHGETGSGGIHSVGQSTFTLEKDSAIYHDPGRFAVERIHRRPGHDMAIMYEFDGKGGMPREEVADVYRRFNEVIDDCFPSGRIWKYLSREHFLLYLDRYGKEGIARLAREEAE